MKTKSTNVITKNKDITSVFVVTAAILTIPMVAMQFSEEWDWNVFDVTAIGTLLIGTGLLMVLASRRIKKVKHRVAIIVALLIAVLVTYIQLAVGIINSLPLAGS